MEPLAPDRAQLTQFVETLFLHADQGTLISMRAFLDHADGTWHYSDWPIVAVNGSLDRIIDTAEDFAKQCATASCAVVFAPPVATFNKTEKATEASLANGLAISVELDTEPSSAEATIKEVLGRATIIVASGGTWSDPATGEVQDKLHCHWRLAVPTRTSIEHDFLKECRQLATRLVDGDPSSIPAVHPMRWPGSWHRKSTPRLTRIVEYNPEIEITLADALNKLRDAVKKKPGPQSNGHDRSNGHATETTEQTSALISTILRGENYHDPIAKLAMRLQMSGMTDAYVVETLRGIMLAVDPGSRDLKDGLLHKDRWLSRYNDISRAVTTARSKIPAAVETEPALPIEKPWPVLDKAALHGPAGEVVALIEDHTESDRVAILLQTLAAYGNCAGRYAYYQVEGTPHFANLYVALIGVTGSRKGTSWGRVYQIFDDTPWAQECVGGGLSSGEGLIQSIRDPIKEIRTDKKTKLETLEIVDPGVADKRLMLVEEELSRPLTAMARPDNTLRDIIRLAWDSKSLRVRTKKSPMHVAKPHVSLIAHSTMSDVATLVDENMATNGLGNRILWACVKRSKYLPEGGDIDPNAIAEIREQIMNTITPYQHARRVRWDPLARQRWHQEYRRLDAERPGLFGAITRRAPAQVVRLSLIYALLDQQDLIGIDHLKAALAVWDYCDQSARYIFGDKTGDSIADTILETLRNTSTGNCGRRCPRTTSR
jgi:hypothetical protein